MTFDLVLANINRNIILEDLPVYCHHLAKGGTLILSGILGADKALVCERAETLGLGFIREVYDNSWISLKFRK